MVEFPLYFLLNTVEDMNHYQRKAFEEIARDHHGTISMDEFCDAMGETGMGRAEAKVCLVLYVTDVLRLHYSFILSRYFFRRWTKRVIVRYTM